MYPNIFSKLDLPWRYQASSDGGVSGNQQDNQSDNQNEGQEETQGEPEDFLSWLESQSDEVKTKAKPLFEAHVANLSNAVKATRRERDDFARQLRDAGKKLETGSEAQKQLEKLSTSLEEANRKSEFYEQAPSFECKNPKAAYALMIANELYTRSGAPDWKAIQSEAPELFGKVSKAPVKKSAGSGTNQEQQKHGSMNDLIRRQSGISIELVD